MSIDKVFTKENLDECLRALAKEFRKLNGKKIPAEIILIGGAAVLVNYGFRDMTYDVDAIIRASSSMKDAINKVGDNLGLPNGWLNSDFTQTKSYSPKLVQHSLFYKQFANVLNVRMVSGEYLIAMKLMSGRQYKNDISDIIGILREEKERGKALTIEEIQTAVNNLYGEWEQLPQESRELIKTILRNDRLDELYDEYRNNERMARESLVTFEQNYPDVVSENNINDIIQNLKKRKQSENE